jgi:protein disulfide-isomerase-like protein
LYQGGRSIEDLTNFVTTKAQEYNVKAPLSNNKQSTINSLGQVIVLDNKNYESSLKNGEPWLVEYYAPWCGHCKALAPTYEELAKELKGKVNVAKVDCPANEAICRSQKVRGYPTIKLHQNGQASEFNGQRQLTNLAAFAVGGTT